MATQVQLRRGTTAQNNAFTGASGEISVNTSNNTIRVHDGSTLGGFELARAGNITSILTSTSAQLLSIISDETGTGSLVFATSPTLVTPDLGTPSAAVLTNASGTASNLTVGKITITNETASSSTYYPMLSVGTSSGNSANVSSTKLTFTPSTGLLTSTDYNSSSDKRLKKNIKTVTNALETVASLRGVSFDWKEGGGKSIGLIAQEVKEVIPDIVTTDENGYMGIKYTNIIGLLVEAIKEQQDQINTLKKQIEKL